MRHAPYNHGDGSSRGHDLWHIGIVMELMFLLDLVVRIVRSCLKLPQVYRGKHSTGFLIYYLWYFVQGSMNFEVVNDEAECISWRSWSPVFFFFLCVWNLLSLGALAKPFHLMLLGKPSFLISLGATNRQDYLSSKFFGWWSTSRKSNHSFYKKKAMKWVFNSSL